MSYTESQLIPGETIRYQAHVHWWPYLPAYILVALSAVMAIVGFINQAWPLGVGGIVLGAGVLAWAYLARSASEFSVTDRRVIIKVGMAQRRTLETMLGKVEGIAVEQDMMGRMLGFGTIVVTGTGGTHETFKNVADPLEFRRQVQLNVHSVDDSRRALSGTPDASLRTDTREERECPYCAEKILKKARVCRFCQRDVEPIVS